MARWAMNVMPNKPVYNIHYFQQELFRHEDFLRLSADEKQNMMIDWVRQARTLASEKPFEEYFPGFPFGRFLEGRTVLDLGCSIGGKTFTLAEKYNLRMSGIDVDPDSIRAAQAYLSHPGSLRARYDFRCAYAEDLPFDDCTFDAIVSQDTIEHVRDIRRTLTECRRVLKKGGLAFLVFPSYYFPLGGAHIGIATRTPFLEWFFSAGTLNEAFKDIVSHWDERFDWFRHKRDGRYGNWEKVEGGIGINGITYRAFNALLEEMPFSRTEFFRIPLGSVSLLASRHPIVKQLSGWMKSLMKWDWAADHLSQRLAYILTT